MATRTLIAAVWRRFLVNENGSEPVSFVLITPLVLFLVLGLGQLSLALWVRTTLIDAAAAGAHAASVAGADPRTAQDIVRQSLASTLGADYVTQVSVRHTLLGKVSNDFVNSTVRVVEVRLEAPVPVIGLAGIGSIEAVGHAVTEVGPS